jgi:hypothetical protein
VTLEKPLRIDIPVRLTELRIAFSIADLAFEGDLPASIFHLQLIANDIANWKANAQVIAVFHTNAGHVTLHDDAYNADRMVATGNPCKQLVVELMNRGVDVELCGETATAHKHGRHGTNVAARSRRVRSDHGMGLTHAKRLPE